MVDALALVPLALLCLALLNSVGPGLDVWGTVALTVALVTPLFWRRRHPLPVFVITALMSFLQWTAGIQWAPGLPVIPADVAVLIAMYGVAARCTLRWAIATAAVAELGILLIIIWPNGPMGTLLGPGGTPETVLRGLAFFSALVVAIWVSGIYANTRRRYVESLVDRAEQAERERDQQAVITVAAERARIARELHDVVAHNVSVIVVHADGAGYAIDGNPEQARQAIQTISTTGRRALTEMRRLVGVLRDDASGEESHAPQPGLAQLGELIENARASGLPTEFATYGTPRDLPEGAQLVIYRIVQEALTNTLKHGGPGTRATVEIGFDTDEIKLKIADDGRGASTLHVQGGHGLIGMRERVAMYGGAVKAAPKIGGGFHVFARIPVDQDE